jgi:alkylated DNA repair dioxygenase AlkB
MTLAPRSAYLLSGPARNIWEHSIAPLDEHRYSITLRTLASSRSALLPRGVQRGAKRR